MSQPRMKSTETGEWVDTDPEPGTVPAPDAIPIAKRFNAVARELGPIDKNRRGEHGAAFRGIDDVYNAVNPLLAKWGVLFIPFVVDIKTEERTSRNDTAMIYRILTVDYHICGIDGDELPHPIRVVAEANDSGDKACSKAMAYADKVALIQAFKIPTSDMSGAGDPDASTETAKPRGRDTGVLNKYRLDDARGKPITEGSDEYLENYAKKVARLLEQGKPYVSREHLDAVERELETRRRRAAKQSGEPDSGPPEFCECGGVFDNEGFCVECGLSVHN